LAVAVLALLLACSPGATRAPDAEDTVAALMESIVGADRERIDPGDRDAVRSLLTATGLETFGDPLNDGFLDRFWHSAQVRGNPIGYVILESSEESSGARVKTILCYPKFPAADSFLLERTDDGWKIDSIEPLGPAELAPCTVGRDP